MTVRSGKKKHINFDKLVIKQQASWWGNGISEPCWPRCYCQGGQQVLKVHFAHHLLNRKTEDATDTLLQGTRAEKQQGSCSYKGTKTQGTCQREEKTEAEKCFCYFADFVMWLVMCELRENWPGVPQAVTTKLKIWERKGYMGCSVGPTPGPGGLEDNLARRKGIKIMSAQPMET